MAGEWVAITGPSGSGKSTLVNLRQQFLWPVSAAILTGVAVVAVGIPLWASGLCFALCAFVTVTIAQEFWRGARVRQGATGTDVVTALIGLVGRSGAGKSTLINLLLRFHDVESGRILIDGQDIAQVTQDSLRAAIGVVTQDSSLLHRSVRDNIAYGRPDASPAQIEAATRLAEAAESLYLTERTLRRQLAAAGESFAAIRDRVREKRATLLLAESTLSVGAIAAEVGFSEPREFRRAYRRWTGRPPSATRAG